MKGKKLDEETCQQIINLWMNYDYNQQKIADTLGVGYSTVRRIIGEYTQDGSHTPPTGMLPPAPAEKPERKPQINEEFDAAVDQMIAEAKAEPVTMAEEEHTVKIPDAVMQAVADKIETLSEVLSDNLVTIKKMQQENEQIRSELAILYGWRAEHEGVEN